MGECHPKTSKSVTPIEHSSHSHPFFKQSYTLRWRTSEGHHPRSAVCEVFVRDGYHLINSELESSEKSELCVSTTIMDSARRVSQCKTTKGWLNPPYSRCGCLRIRKRIQADDNSTKSWRHNLVSRLLLPTTFFFSGFYFSRHIRLWDPAAWIFATWNQKNFRKYSQGSNLLERRDWWQG